MDEKTIALLIDADNISKKYIGPLLDELSNFGIITIKRIYGNWTSTDKQNWKPILLDYSIQPFQQFNYTTGKNATDSAMIIDGMDILYTKNIDIFCLVSSDSDFTRLATRLRESGKIVIGMGQTQTPKPFIRSCNEFKYLEAISSEETVQLPKTKNIEEIKQAIIDIITENGNGYMYLGLLGQRLISRYSDFDSRNYGYVSLHKLLSKFNEFEIKKNGTIYDVYIKKANKDSTIKQDIINIVKNAKKKAINMGSLNKKIKEINKDFNIKTLGYTKFRQLIEEIDELEIKNLDVVLKK